MPRQFRSAAVILCLLAAPALLQAGAWTQPRGGYYTKLTLISSDANGIYGSASPATFTDYALYLYGEYGVLPEVTLVLSTPLFKDSQNEANFLRGNTTGILAGDTELQVKYGILSKPLVVSALAGVKVPVAYEIEDIPPLGNGETDIDVKLLVGGSLYPIPMYITGDIGYRVRGGDFVDEIQYSLEAGYTLWNRYLLRGLITGISATEEAAGESNLFGFPLSQDRRRMGGGLIVKLTDRIEMDLTYLKTTSGTNIPKADEIFVGIAFKS